MSNNGASLSSMLDTCKNVLANMATLGVCTSPCTLPGATQPLFKLDPNHYELGLGNHGEAGVAKINVSFSKIFFNNIYYLYLISFKMSKDGFLICLLFCIYSQY